ncbi:MAG: hypothetical protein E3J30_00580 [Anaerolineales bacterium]|nr:MAG: hypothetical protein E3J30_00580 [Anaerolineales bacterium]
MENVNESPRNLPSLIRRIARIWSIVCFGFFVFIIIMEILYPHGGEGWRPRDMVLAAFIPIGVFLGMALAWRREGLGGALTTLSVIGFYLAMFILDGDLPRLGVFAMLIPLIIPGILFLISWALHRRP